MSKLRLLIVEDDEQELEACRDSVERYGDEKNRDFELIECKSLDEALELLDNSFDGAIIDLKLADGGDEGNQIIKKIEESFFRIPVAIFTANPGNSDHTLNQKIMLLDVFQKRVTQFDELLDRFWDIYDTGLTHIMGGRGLIEQRLNEVFLKNLRSQIPTWVSYGKEDPERTERALLRYTLNHLFQLLEEGDERCYPEEVYLHPPLSGNITTGSIVNEKTSNQPFVVLSPACDLVIKSNGEFRTDRILLVEIEKENHIVDKALVSVKKMRDEKRKREKTKEVLKAVFNNNYTFYYHWLPKTVFFDGGFLNFRKMNALTKNEFDEKYEKPSIQISPFFVKDIVARFSSFYARQGQPDIDSSDFVNHWTAHQGEAQ